MKSNQVLALIILGASLWALYMPQSVPFGPTPSPEAQAIAAELRGHMVGPKASADARVLADILRSTANLLVLDTQRAVPFYPDNESFKWVIRNVGDITYPEGWVMQQTYPTLPGYLAGKLNKLGEDFTRASLVAELRTLADGFAAF